MYLLVNKKVFSLLIIIFVLLNIHISKAQAATLSNISDTLSTSRPSASNPLSANQAANATQVSIIDINQSTNNTIYLASDSAIIRADTGETQNTGITVASMSAQIAGTPNTRNVYLANSISNAHHNGDAFVVPVTALHTVAFTTVNPLASSQKIVITFPVLASGDANNAASPSATTFQTNGLAQAGVKVWDVTGAADITANFTANSGSITITAPTSGTAPIITLTQGTTTTIATNHALKIFIGCTTLSSGACTVQSPTLINPTSSATVVTTGDAWKVSLATQDSSGNAIDTGSAKISTNPAVLVLASVDPSITFSISGIADTTNIHTQNSNCGSSGDILNTGISATATVVNLGSLANGRINIGAQELSVSTNASSGYTITATSSGRFINSVNGQYLQDAQGGNSGLTANDTPVPAVFTATGIQDFGIHACGADATAQWASASDTSFSAGAKYSNPWSTGAQQFYNNIASFTGPASARKTEIEYAATISATTPAGTYQTVLTYVATATF